MLYNRLTSLTIYYRLACRMVSSSSIDRSVKSTRPTPPPLRFSETSAFRSRERLDVIPASPDFFSMHQRKKRKRLIWMCVSVAIIGYVIYYRKELDKILDGDPYDVIPQKRRQILEDKIEKKKSKGQSTELLELELAYQAITTEVLQATREGVN